MQEYVSEALVLSKDPVGELDVRVSLFTKDFGKLVARAKSARKILSKLSAHLEPGNLVRARFIQQKGLQVVDVLKSSRVLTDPHDLYILDRVLAEGVPDYELWTTLVGNTFSWRTTLKTLGWDPSGADCEMCALRTPIAFHSDTQRFFCDSCAFLMPISEIVFI